MISGRKYTNAGVHTGLLLKRKLKELHIPRAELARRINRSPTTILAFTRQHSIQTAILIEICKAVKYNFFKDIMAILPEEIRVEAVDASVNTEEMKTAMELEWLRQENAYLKKMIDILAAKSVAG